MGGKRERGTGEIREREFEPLKLCHQQKKKSLQSMKNIRSRSQKAVWLSVVSLPGQVTCAPLDESHQDRVCCSPVCPPLHFKATWNPPRMLSTEPDTQ